MAKTLAFCKSKFEVNCTNFNDLKQGLESVLNSSLALSLQIKFNSSELTKIKMQFYKFLKV